MKLINAITNKARYFSLMFLFTLYMPLLYAQETLYFPLLSDFTSQESAATSLISLPNATGQTGNFAALAVPATTCPEEQESDGYFFADNAGLQFNNNHFIDCAYSIQFTFKIDDLSGAPAWVRILSFTHVNDVGIYIYKTNPPTNGTLDFWPNGTVGARDFFNSSDIYQMILVRDCAGKVTIYINGQIFDTYDDNSKKYIPQPPNDYIIFFQDHPAVLANESSSGWVKDIYISNYTWTESEIENRWEDFCDSFTPTDCKGVENGTAILDDCGECMEPDDPAFNQSCTDCKGIIDGTAVLDDCGECMEPGDPAFNQSCTDCEGVVNGTSVLDDCGECLEPNAPAFNQSCADCKGVANGLAIIDDCGECLEPNDPAFNQSCTDCRGIVKGTAIIDDCGECLEPTDPTFNQSCSDCAGIPNGTAILDDCGECLEPNDPAFNQSCTDCNGLVNGTAELDDCGECLEPTDPTYNQSCTDCKGIINGTAMIDDCGECLEPNDPDYNNTCSENTVAIPNAFTPNDDGLNDRFEIKGDDTLQIIKYLIYNRWGTLIYQAENFPITDHSKFWNGKTQQAQDAPDGTYIYVIEIMNHPEKYTGQILIYR